MKPEIFLKDRVTLLGGDSLKLLRKLPENSVDSVCTDPPYHLTSIVKRFGADNAAPAKAGKTGAYARASAGFMGKKWDGGDIAFRPEFWIEVLRVLKPGGHLIAFGGTRTYHRMACAIEDAGFEIRDQIAWMYGSGFPKSHDVSKGIDKQAGVERAAPVGRAIKRMIPGADQNKAGWEKNNGREYVPGRSAPASDAAAAWEGWGTALKPALEPVALARKPLSEATVAANVLRWGTGALNIDGCRVGADGGTTRTDGSNSGKARNTLHDGNFGVTSLDAGRWPANLITDGSPEVMEAFPDAPGQAGAVNGREPSTDNRYILSGLSGNHAPREPRNDSGSAARFFYTAKADSDDRLGSKHPTVKPIDLMQYLVRLVTPKGGLCLDPFAGTGTTGEAAWREGLRALLIEREAEYLEDIRRRMKLCLAGPDERQREAIKAKLADKPIDAGPLFGGVL